MTVLLPATLADATARGRSLPLTALPAPHGPHRPTRSIGVGFRLRGDQTGGQVAIVEHPFPPGAFVPPDVPTREDEFSIVTTGAIGFRSGADEIVLEAGGYLSKPRGALHTHPERWTRRSPSDRGDHAAGLRELFSRTGRRV